MSKSQGFARKISTNIWDGKGLNIQGVGRGTARRIILFLPQSPGFTIGTPTIHPAIVARLTRALYQDDSEPISEQSEQDSQGIRRYTDPRMQRVNDYLTRTELTQCAHRSRALRQVRTVVTFCLGDIDYLPPTETVTQLPQLTSDGRERWTASRQVEREKIEQACQMIEMDGKSIHMLTVRELKAAAGVSTDAAADYLRQARDQAIQNQEREHSYYTPHTHLCPQLVPDAPGKLTEGWTDFAPKGGNLH